MLFQHFNTEVDSLTIFLISTFLILIPFLTGMIDAYGKIYKSEGVSGLYRGFWISSVQIVSGKSILYLLFFSVCICKYYTNTNIIC